jgi:phosphonate transport system substrate-binding protein
LRNWIAAILLYWTFTGMVPIVSTGSKAEPAPLRIGLTPVFLDDQTAFVNAWQDYLARRLNRPVQVVQRATYREITDLLRSGKLEFAWVCGFPYVHNKDAMTLLAVPVYQGKPTYRSYLIVPASDHRTASIADLRGKVFAFSDRDSNSGYLVPAHDLLALHATPASFFSRTFFTWSHRNVVQAVADGLAQGGAVDSYVWDMLAIQSPKLTAQTRVVNASDEYGFPPFVAAKGVAPEDVELMRRTLIAMPQDAEGAKLLQQLRLDGFVAGDDQLFTSIETMMRAMEQ